jgi:hypothetical protein
MVSLYHRPIVNWQRPLMRPKSIAVLVSCLWLALSIAASGSAQESCRFTVRDERGAIVGRVDASGSVRNATGRLIGRIKDGKVRDGNGAMRGSIDQRGSVRGRTGALMGRVEGDGKLRDAGGALLGRISSDGRVRNRNGALRGRIEGFSSTCQNVAAAYLFFLEPLFKR